jgi:hypothetical protein
MLPLNHLAVRWLNGLVQAQVLAALSSEGDGYDIIDVHDLPRQNHV